MKIIQKSLFRVFNRFYPVSRNSKYFYKFKKFGSCYAPEKSIKNRGKLSFMLNLPTLNVPMSTIKYIISLAVPTRLPHSNKKRTLPSQHAVSPKFHYAHSKVRLLKLRPLE